MVWSESGGCGRRERRRGGRLFGHCYALDRGNDRSYISRERYIPPNADVRPQSSMATAATTATAASVLR